MVEKVSEVSMNVDMKGDSTPDDNALLKHIAKKKRQDQGDETISLLAMLPPSALVRLTTTLAQGGGLQKTEKQVVKEDAPTSLGPAVDPRQTTKGDALRRQVALAFAGQMATPNTGKKNLSVQKGEVTSALSTKVAASVPKSDGQSNTPVPATNTLVDAVTKLHHSATAQHSQAAAVVNPVIVNKLAPETEARRQDKPLRTKDDFGEARPFWQGAKQAESMMPKQGQTTAQSKNSPAMLQQLKAQASSAGGLKGGNEGQTLEVNYQFQRWSGDHSVRISVPTEVRREGNITLLPSDARAADVLLRNMGHLTSLSPDLLRPQQEPDEQQQRRQQQQQDEDQE